MARMLLGRALGFAVAAAWLLSAAPAHADFCTIPSLCSIAKANTDLTIAHVELNQVIQDWGNHIPLVVGKPLAVRVSVEASGDVNPIGTGDWFVDGALMDVWHGSTHLGTLSPTASSVAVKPSFVDPESYRADASRTVNFLLPSLWQFTDGVTLVITINSLFHVPETNTKNDSVTVPLTLKRTVIPQVVGLSYSSPAHPYSRSSHLASYFAQLPAAAHLWPVSSMYFVDCCGEQQYWSQPRPDLNPGPTPTDLYFPGALAVVTKASQARQTTLGGQFVNDLWYVLQPWYTGLNGGTLPSGKTWPAYALTASTGQDTTGVAEGWVMAHELAHQFSQLHTGGNVTQFVDPSCCVGGRINALHASTFGFDTNTMRVVPPTAIDGTVFAHDFMAYFNVNQWVSDYTYERLFRTLSSPISASVASVRAAAIVPRLFVTGTISGDQATLDPAFALSAPPDAIADAGPYELQLRDAAGAVLSSRRFAADTTDPTPLGPLDTGPLAFSTSLPDAPAATSLVLLRDGQVLATTSRSAHAPAVTIDKPAPGVHWEGAKVVSWTASDPDGDPLSYLVQYSADGGQSWLTVATGLRDTSLPIDAGTLQGSRDCLVRVLASDGLTTTVATSARFGVNPHAPRVRITAARAVRGGRQLRLEATAIDPDQGRLADRAIVWRSSRAGRLGTGANLLTGPLSPGRQRITVTATDATGRRGTAHRVITLLGPRLPGAPRHVRLAGGTLRWEAASGPVLRYVVQRAAASSRIARFTTIASLPPRSRSFALPHASGRRVYRVGACRLAGCTFAAA